MILTITYLVVALLHPTQPTHVATLHPQHGYSIQLHPNTIKSVPLGEAHPTIVKTWTVQ